MKNFNHLEELVSPNYKCINVFLLFFFFFFFFFSINEVCDYQTKLY